MQQESSNAIEAPNIYIHQTVIRPTLLYGCETWPMSGKDEKRMTTTETRMVRWPMGDEPIGSEGGTDSGGYDNEKAGMVWAR